MKKSIYAIALLSVMGLNQTIAQDVSAPLLAKQTTNQQMFIAPGGVEVKKFNVVAEETFANEFKNTNNVSWSREGERYRVRFMQDNISCVVDYTAKGKQYSCIRYGTSLLPASMKESINKKFDVISILSVSEVRMSGFNSLAYVVVFDDKNSVKTVRIIDNDVEIISEAFKKS